MLCQFVLTMSQAVLNYCRSFLMLNISSRINIRLISDFLGKLIQLPMPYFDAKPLGDLMQRMHDNERIQNFLTQHLLSMRFYTLSLVVFSIVLYIYNKTIFFIFVVGSLLYAAWFSLFMKKRRLLEYMRFECEAANNNKTYQFLSSIPEIKLQDCEARRRKEWVGIQRDLWQVNAKNLKLLQTEEIGSTFINEAKNILI